MNINMNQTPPIACDLTAIPASVREQHLSATPQIFQAAQEVQELPAGYAFRFLNEPGRFMALAQFVENERLCCPFFGFALEIEPGGGRLWLRLTGGEGVKEFMGIVFGDLSEAIRKQLIQTGGDAHLDEGVGQTLPRMAGILDKASPAS